MAKVLVTGGSGFIGSNLVLELEKQGDDVTVIDSLHSGNPENAKEFKGKVIKADISKKFDIKGSFDIIYHEAAITDPRYPNDEEVMQANVEGFKNILALTLKNKAKLIYASSASMYGNGPVPMKEDQKKELLNTYAKSKLMMDEIAQKHFDELHIVGLRYFNVFGPREHFKGRPSSMIYHLGQQMKAGKNPRIFKWGEQKRDHIYVKDVVDATIKASKAKKSCIVNVATGTATDFNELVKILNEVLRTNLKPEYFDNPYGDTYQNNTQGDTEKAKKLIGFKAKWRLKDGIKDYFRWLYGRK